MPKITRRLSSSQIIILGFAGVILLGSFLLVLPVSSKSGQWTSFVDALFTSTSAVCVTGLVVQDTGSYWSTFGQVVIIALIQIGGMGVVTVAVAIAKLSGKKIGLKGRSIMQESVSAHRMGGIVRLTGFIVKGTIIFELLGAAIMAPTFCREFGLITGLWYALFHSISAFCNAGFDLMGVREQYSSITYFVANPAINIAVMSLIVIGGLSFMTWEDISVHKHRFSRYKLQSKVILVTTALLIIIPAAYFFFFEFGDRPFTERLLSSFFQSITPRTAGFNTVNLNAISETGLAIMILLMLIGGSPGSTAGGMKTTTFAVMLSNAVSVFRRRENPQFFGRRVSDDTVKSAATIFTMYITLCLAGGFIISRIEDLPLLACMYDSASAIGTVGLSLGITPGLGLVSRFILISLMYIGRVGGLTLIFATIHGNQSYSRLPEEKLNVG